MYVWWHWTMQALVSWLYGITRPVTGWLMVIFPACHLIGPWLSFQSLPGCVCFPSSIYPPPHPTPQMLLWCFHDDLLTIDSDSDHSNKTTVGPKITCNNMTINHQVYTCLQTSQPTRGGKWILEKHTASRRLLWQTGMMIMVSDLRL